jgi:hypothetical protein
VNAGDALVELVGSFADATVDALVSTIQAEGFPKDDRRATFIAYAGLVDLLAERMLAATAIEDRVTTLERARRAAEAADGPLRFARHEQRSTTERDELISRMRGRQIAMTQGWLAPKLRTEIALYERRIDALRMAIEARER